MSWQCKKWEKKEEDTLMHAHTNKHIKQQPKKIECDTEMCASCEQWLRS